MPWSKGSLLWIRRGRPPSSGPVFVLRKSLGTAVLRNKLRRRLRHICRHLPTSASEGLVILAQPVAAQSSFAALRTELARLVVSLDDGEPKGQR